MGYYVPPFLWILGPSLKRHMDHTQWSFVALLDNEKGLRVACVHPCVSRETSHLLQEVGLDVSRTTPPPTQTHAIHNSHRLGPKPQNRPLLRPATDQAWNTFRPWDTRTPLQSTWRRRQSQQLERRRISPHSPNSRRNDTSTAGK
jgi:hypothetical protein